MDDTTLIGNWASGIWLDLGSPTNTTPSTISGYAIQPSTLGKLNNLLGTCFSGSGYTGAGASNYQIGPWITITELSVLEQMYLVSYYRNLAQSAMGIGGSSIPWTRIREADSSIDRANASNLGKEYREMSKDAVEQLNYLANAYRTNSAGGNIPRSVDYYMLGAAGWNTNYASI